MITSFFWLLCHYYIIPYSILHVFVCRVPAPEQKKQKKERKELQVWTLDYS